MIPRQIKQFIDAFAGLPSIGVRQATRLAFRLIHSGQANIDETAEAVKNLRALKLCAECFFVHDGSGTLCSICSNPARLKNLIMIVEKETDLISLERPGTFKGRYMIIGEMKKSGILESDQALRINRLQAFIKKELDNTAQEIILAMNPTTYGDLNAAVLTRELKDYAKKITRLGRGIPTGGEIEFADEDTLGQALERRI